MDSIIDSLRKIELEDGTDSLDETLKNKDLEDGTELLDETLKNEDLVSKERKDQKEMVIAKDANQDNGINNVVALFSSLTTSDIQKEEIKDLASSDNDSWNSYYKLFDPIQNQNQLATELNWDSNSESDAAATNADINFDNIFDDVANLSKIEKQLDLFYRPFTCTMDSNCHFNLYDLCILMPDSRCDLGSHPSVSIKVRYPVAVVKVYEGGKFVSTALTADSARNALLTVIKMVQALDLRAEINIFRHSIVNASFCMPFKLDLELLAELHADQVSYNIKTRPFLTYSIDGTDIRFAVFASGYVLVLYSTMHSETRAAIDGFLPILANFKSGYPSAIEKNGIVFGDITYKLLWEHKLEEDRDGLLLYS